MNFKVIESRREEAQPQWEEKEFIYFRKKRILVVEEDWDFSQLFMRQLPQHLDVDVKLVKNAYQALSRMTHELFDVVILDSPLNPFQALVEAELFLEPLTDLHFDDLGKVPVIVLADDVDQSLQGLESHLFRITCLVQKQLPLAATVSLVEAELCDLLEI